jgi:hypothetical protein
MQYLTFVGGRAAHDDRKVEQQVSNFYRCFLNHSAIRLFLFLCFEKKYTCIALLLLLKIIYLITTKSFMGN